MSDNFENKENLTPETNPAQQDVQPAQPEATPAEQTTAEQAAPQQPQEPASQTDPSAPVNGAYHYRTYDLQQRTRPQEQSQNQATFGTAD